MSFSSLPLSAATQAALKSMHIATPTPIQEQALPLLLQGRDLIGQAKTGSGKTLAFAIPMVERVDPEQRAVQALVLVPTRELAQQVGDVVQALAREHRLHLALIFGGRAMGPQIAALKTGPQIVVGTPGRVLDLLRQGVFQPGQVRYLVLDEADEMLDQGFAPDVERILSFMPAGRQTVLLSATVPDWVQHTAHKHLHDPATVRIDVRPEDAPRIDHVIYDVEEGQKLPVLRVLLDRRDEDSVLVFGRTKHGVKKLAKQLAALGYPAAALQGNLSQNARDAVMADFRSRRVPILLATNVAARGLDVDHIGLVVNYELPETPELLTHRVGRTGRMGREGDAVTLLAPSDEDKWRKLSRELRVRIPRQPWTGGVPATPAEVQAIPLYEPRPARGRSEALPTLSPASSSARGAERQPSGRRGVVATLDVQAQPRLLAAGGERSPRPGGGRDFGRRPAQESGGGSQAGPGRDRRPDRARGGAGAAPRRGRPGDTPGRARAEAWERPYGEKERETRAAGEPRSGRRGQPISLPRRQTIPEHERKTGRTWREDRELLDIESEAMPHVDASTVQETGWPPRAEQSGRPDGQSEPREASRAGRRWRSRRRPGGPR